MTASQKGSIFISYRRADSAGHAGRIYDRLTAHFRKDAVFMDVDTIEAGLDFVAVLQNAVQSCDVLVALIGRQWVSIKDENGKRRIENPEDFVCIEIAAALDRDIRVIPVLVDGTSMPNSSELPGNLKPLARRNALQVNHHSFNADVHRLISQLELALKAAEDSKIIKAQRLREEQERKQRKEEIDKHLESADLAINLKDWGLAREKLTGVLELEPTHAGARGKLDIVQRKIAEDKIKHEEADRKRKQAEAEENVIRKKENHYIQQESYSPKQKIFSRLQPVVKPREDTSQIVNLRKYNREIESIIDRGDWGSAIAHCGHILQSFPKHLDTHRFLGKACLETKRFSEALDIFSQVLDAVPNDFVSNVGMSIICDEENNVENSIWYMERAFETQPSNKAIQVELQRLYGRRDGIVPSRIRMTRGALANMNVQGELFPQAILEIKSVLEEDSERYDMQALLALAYFRSGEKDKAEDIAYSVLQKYPYCFEANRIVVECLRKRNLTKIEVSLRRVIELDPYAAFVTDSIFNSNEVPDDKVFLYRLRPNG